MYKSGGDDEGIHGMTMMMTGEKSDSIIALVPKRAL